MHHPGPQNIKVKEICDRMWWGVMTLGTQSHWAGLCPRWVASGGSVQLDTPQLHCWGDDSPVCHNMVVGTRELHEPHSPNSRALSGGLCAGQTTVLRSPPDARAHSPSPPAPLGPLLHLSAAFATVLGPVLLLLFNQRCILSFLKVPLTLRPLLLFCLW